MLNVDDYLCVCILFIKLDYYGLADPSWSLAFGLSLRAFVQPAGLTLRVSLAPSCLALSTLSLKLPKCSITACVIKVFMCLLRRMRLASPRPWLRHECQYSVYTLASLCASSFTASVTFVVSVSISVHTLSTPRV